MRLSLRHACDLGDRNRGGIGSGEETTALLVEHGWSESMWKNGKSQIQKQLAWCDEEGHDEYSAPEGDALANIGYLLVES